MYFGVVLPSRYWLRGDEGYPPFLASRKCKRVPFPRGPVKKASLTLCVSSLMHHFLSLSLSLRICRRLSFLPYLPSGVMLQDEPRGQTCFHGAGHKHTRVVEKEKLKSPPLCVKGGPKLLANSGDVLLSSSSFTVALDQRSASSKKAGKYLRNGGLVPFPGSYLSPYYTWLGHIRRRRRRTFEGGRRPRFIFPCDFSSLSLSPFLGLYVLFVLTIDVSPLPSPLPSFSYNSFLSSFASEAEI